MLIGCEYNNIQWISRKTDFYTCLIEGLSYKSDEKLKVIGNHLNGKTNNDVEAIDFENCDLDEIPSGLAEIFPNIDTLQVYNSKLKVIKKEDIKDFKKIKDLFLASNEIKKIPGNLFESKTDIEIIKLCCNKIEFIGSELLDGLKKLKFVDLRKNININMWFNELRNEGNATLEEIITEIREKCSPNKFHDFKKIIDSEESKDFTIKIDKREFKVHKILMIIRCPTIAELIKNDPEATELILVDIDVVIFQKILNYFYVSILII